MAQERPISAAEGWARGRKAALQGFQARTRGAPAPLRTVQEGGPQDVVGAREDNRKGGQLRRGTERLRGDRDCSGLGGVANRVGEGRPPEPRPW